MVFSVVYLQLLKQAIYGNFIFLLHDILKFAICTNLNVGFFFI